MIDRGSRDQIAALLKDLGTGKVTKVQFDERRPRSRDRAVREVVAQARLLLGDAREDPESGGLELGRDDRRDVERWILFLQTDLPYRWPILPLWARILGLIPSVLTFGLFWRPYRLWFERQGDFRVWPFLERRELDAARPVRPAGRGRRVP